MNNTGIIWTEVTWNPTTGCKEITPGCAFCYAKTIAEDKRGLAFPLGFNLTYRPHKLDEPKRLKQPSLIFVNSMSDLFWDQITDEYRDKVLDVIEATPQHQYQVLTKRDEELLRYSRRRKLPANFWAGVTIESQAYVKRADTLRKVRAQIRFLSCEPMLSEIRLNLTDLHWVIGGGESGRHLFDERFSAPRAMAEYVRGEKRWQPREDRYDWARVLRDQCVAAGVPFFWKQWGGATPKSGGRMLDERTWDEFPRYPEGKMEISNPHLERVTPTPKRQRKLI